MSYLTKADIAPRNISIDMEPEVDIAPDFDSGEPDFDAAASREIRERLARGDDWAWCEVQVRVTWRGFKGESSWLGGCSYASEQDFREPGGYFDDLLDEAIDDLNLAIRRAESPELRLVAS